MKAWGWGGDLFGSRESNIEMYFFLVNNKRNSIRRDGVEVADDT